MFPLDTHPTLRLNVVQISRELGCPRKGQPTPRCFRPCEWNYPKQFDSSLRGTTPSREGRRKLRGCRPQGQHSRCSGQEFKRRESHLGTASVPKPQPIPLGRALRETHTQVDWNGTRESPVAPLYGISWRPMAKVFVCLRSPLPES